MTLAELLFGQEPVKRSRQKQLLFITHQLIQDVCTTYMTTDAPKDSTTDCQWQAALERVSPLKRKDEYTTVGQPNEW